MFNRKTSIRPVVLSMALATTSLGAFAQIHEPPRPRDVPTLESAARGRVTPNVTGIKVQDVDQPARAPFQTTVQINVSNFNYTPVAIPAGQRLVIDYVSLAGSAASSGGPIQPIAVLLTSVAGGPNTYYYLAPTATPGLPSQFYHTENPVIYADTLQVGPAFAGYTPDFLTMSVVISGHLISNP